MVDLIFVGCFKIGGIARGLSLTYLALCSLPPNGFILYRVGFAYVLFNLSSLFEE
jgi:hypothetical protein